MTIRRALLVLLCLCLTVPAGPVGAQSGPVEIRIGDHPTFSRLVLDFNIAPDYELRQDGTQLVLSFPAGIALDAGRLAADPLERISDPDIRRTDRGTIASFRVPADAGVRQFMSGSSLVIDVMDGEAPASSASRAAADGQADAASTASSDAAETSAGTASDQPAEDAGTIRVSLLSEGEDSLLRFGWPTATPAAVFVRAGYLWVVFERARAVSHAGLDFSDAGAAGALIGPPERLAPDWATVLRYRLRKPLFVTAGLEAPVWEVRLSERPRLPRDIIVPERSEGSSGVGLFLGAADAGSRIRVTDPAVGDMLDIVPIGDDGRGLAEPAEYVEFTLLQTAQGIVVSPRSEAVAVRRFTDGIGIFGEDGLALSNPSLAAGGNGSALLDLPGWRQGVDVAAFRDTEQSLRIALSLASDTERRDARWALARYYLGHGLDAEALGILELMRARDPGMAERREWKAAYGVALLGLSRPGEALGPLLDPRLDSESDVWLWRALAAEGAGRHEDALLYFERGVDALDVYDRPFRARLRLAMARAALARESHDAAESHLLAVRTLRPEDGTVLAAVDYLSGRLAERRGDFPEARDAYRRATDGPSRRVSVEARFALAQLEQREGIISPADTIRRLERLRFAWRGDALESRILGRLAELYIDENRYREGLELYRTAAANIADSDMARHFTSKMSAVFDSLFLEGRADNLSPVAALSLFYDFQELTPLGGEGDRMIRKLSDRLVAVGLLGRAADLLRHQVEFRLDGAAQAQVAAELARIYLADSRPQEALDIMRATRDVALPSDILDLRNLIEARALAEMSRYEEAIALLENDSSMSAELLRADIFWSDRDWSSLAAVTARILDAGATDAEAPLGLQDRQHVLRRAIALSFMEDADGLQRLRARYGEKMRDGEMARIFNTLTSPTPPAAGELGRIAGRLAGLDEFQSFLSAYRDEFTPGALDNAGRAES